MEKDLPATRPQKVLQLQALEDLETNPHFRTLFLHFEGQRKVLVLTAEWEEDFKIWEHAFRLYSPFSQHEVNAH